MDRPDLPIIVESDTSNLSRNTTTSGGSRLRSFRIPKIVFIILAIIILGEVVIGLRTITAPQPTIGKVQPLTGGRMILSSDGTTYKVGETIPVRVRVDTGGYSVNGVDLVLKYDPNVLDILPSGIISGGMFSEYPLKSINPIAGSVQVSGITSSTQQPYNGIGVFVTLNFVAKQKGQTQLSILYRPGATTDSNITDAATSSDIINSAYDLNLDIN